MDELINFKADGTGVAFGKIPNDCIYHIYTPNEVRAMCGLEPINSPDGDGEFVVSNGFRSIHIPDSIMNTVVRGDEYMPFNFRMPRYWYGFEPPLSECDICIEYVDMNGVTNCYIIQDKIASGDYIRFTWYIDHRVVYKNTIRFRLCLSGRHVSYYTDVVDIPVSIYDAPQHSETKQITNCVNCGAPVDPRHDHCEYCGTSYRLMGIIPTPDANIPCYIDATKINAGAIKRLTGELKLLNAEYIKLGRLI